MGTNTRTPRRVNEVKQEGKKLANEATTSPLIETLTRLGYIARGLIYGVIGVLALQVAMGGSGILADPQGAIVAMGKTSIGGIVLYAVLVGLIGYALWGFIRAVFDPLHKGTHLKGIAERVGFLASGVSYGVLAVATYGLITSKATAAHNGAQTTQTQQATASILSNSWGPWVVGIAGVIVIGVGLLYIVQAIRDDFDKLYQPYALSSEERKWMERAGRFGIGARGVVFALVGLFLFLAAYRHDPSEAQGISGVLAALLQQPYGPWLLGIVALGLIAFGIYSAMSGVWLRLRR